MVDDRIESMSTGMKTTTEGETTLIDCGDCGEAFRICGKNGTSIGYVRHCPHCGSDSVVTDTEIVDLLHCDYYAEEVNLTGGDGDGK